MLSVRPADLALAGLLAVTALLEVAAAGVEARRPSATLALTLLAAAAMLVRSAWPLLCLAVVVPLVVVAQVPAMGTTLTAAVVMGCLFALATVGRHCRDVASVPAVVGTVVVFVVGAAFSGRPWDVVVALIGCGAAWGAGRLLRREADRSAQLSTLASDLVAQRELRAREAVHAERLRIARELHDTVAHVVSVMTLHVGAVRRRLDDDPARAIERDTLLDVERLGREAVGELHRLLGVLRTSDADTVPEVQPPDEATPLAPQPRLADLEQLAGRVRMAGVPVELRVEGPPRALSSGLELAAYRVVQEALTNVLKHAEGATARVTVAYTERDLRLVVVDDGHPTGEDADGTGHGLSGIRERVALYGGHVDAGPVLPRGFAVRATLPLAQPGVP